MPMMKRQVYFFWLFPGDLSALDVEELATADVGAPQVCPGGGNPQAGKGMPGYGGGIAGLLAQLIRKVPSRPFSTLPLRSFMAAWASGNCSKMIMALAPASSTRICLTDPYRLKTLCRSSSVN
eukprot:Skav207499  [mRNA]  locus=scaffold334:146593:150500:+ [translate_table: standard]